MSDNPENSSVPKRRRLPRWLKIVLGVLLVSFIVVWYFLPAQTIDRPVVLKRNDSGHLIPVTGSDQSSGIEIKAHAGALKANNSTISAGSTSSSTPNYFPNRSMAIINLSDHLLMSRVSETVLKELKQKHPFERIEYYPAGHLPEAGVLTPDLILTLDLNAFEESGIASTKLNAKVSANWGIAFAQSNHSVWNHLSAPVVEVDYKITVNHESVYTGVESSAARYEQQSQNIGQEITKTILKNLQEYTKKYNPLPDLPVGFYPAYEATPEFDFLTKYEAKQLTSFHGLCFQNETFWQIDEMKNAETILQSIHTELQEKGWKGELGKLDPSRVAHQRMEKAGDILEVFSLREQIFGLEDRSKNKPITLYVRYRSPMKKEAHHLVYEELITNPEPNYQLLLDMQKYADSKQRVRLIEMIKEQTPQTTSAWLFLAQHYQRAENLSALLDALRKTHHLTYTMTDFSQVESEIKRLAKKADLKLEQIKEVDPELFQQLGIPDLKRGMESITREIRPGETVSFFIQSNDTDWGVVSVIFDQKLKENTDLIFNATILESDSNSSRMWHNTTFNAKTSYKHPSHIGKVPVMLELSESDTGNMQVTARVED